MIVVEERLHEAFNTLPNVGMSEDNPLGFKPVYKWGNEAHLTKQLRLNKELYPLIYQTSSAENQTSRGNTVEVPLVLVLATPNSNTDQVNEVRWVGSYANVLHPLLRNIEILFTKGSIFVWDGDYSVTRFPNYGNESSTANKAIDIWDALRFETTIKIYNNKVCLKTFKY